MRTANLALFVLTLVVISHTKSFAAEWKKLSKNSFHLRHETKEALILDAIKFVKQNFVAEIIDLRDYAKKGSNSPNSPYTLKAIYERKPKSMAVLNGGFSSHMEFPIPIGMLLVNSKQKSEPNLKAKFFDQIFCINDKKLSIIPATIEPKCKFAVQAGPLLVNNGTVQEMEDKYKKQKSERSVLCINASDDLLLIHSIKMRYAQLQEILVEPEFNCEKAMALSGGIQSGLIGGLLD
ncbi:MAG: phosphodiester glycosidase family protein [Oligoflexales bacterium]